VSTTLAVGFADLCGFTRLSRMLDYPALALLLDRFEAIVDSVVRDNRGRLVKLMGDGAMFTAANPSAAVGIGVSLIEQAAADDLVPPVRVGVSYGQVLLRRGDCFGPVVNRASRIMEIAPEESVVVDSSALTAAFSCDPLGVIDLRDCEPAPLWSVQCSRGAEQARSLASTAASRLAL
jgi:adenylate cyclase